MFYKLSAPLCNEDNSNYDLDCYSAGCYVLILNVVKLIEMM